MKMSSSLGKINLLLKNKKPLLLAESKCNSLLWPGRKVNTCYDQFNRKYFSLNLIGKQNYQTNQYNYQQQNTSSGQYSDKSKKRIILTIVIPLISCIIFIYVTLWKHRKVKADYKFLQDYLEKYQDQLKEQALEAGVTSILHPEHRPLLNDLISQSTEVGKYLVNSDFPFDLDLKPFSEITTHKQHPIAETKVTYALWPDIWYLEPNTNKKSDKNFVAYGKKCYDARDLTITFHLPMKIYAKPSNEKILPNIMREKPLFYFSLNVEMKATEKNFTAGSIPSLSISKITISPVSKYYTTLTFKQEFQQRPFDEIAVEEAIAPNGIHHSTDGLYYIKKQFGLDEER
ncbi:hypothetical protein ABK040_008948 [Willaertia magna]